MSTKKKEGSDTTDLYAGPEEEAKKVYERKENEWYTDNDLDNDLGVETFNYPNGSVAKRCKLKDGRLAVTHLLKGKDRENLRRITRGDSKLVQDAVMALSTKINDKAMVIEDIDELWFPDYTRLQTMVSSINFI